MKYGAGERIRTLDPNLGKVAIVIARGGATASAILAGRGKSGRFARAIVHMSVNKSTKNTV
jgi:hypothetical protein